MLGQFAFVVAVVAIMSFVVNLYGLVIRPVQVRRVLSKHVIPDFLAYMREHEELEICDDGMDMGDGRGRRDAGIARSGDSTSESAEDDVAEEVPVAEDSFAALRDLYGDSESSDSGR